MNLYDKIFDVVKQFRKLFSPGPVTNVDVSGSISAEIFLIVSLILATLLLRHIIILLAGLLALITAIILIVNIPLIPKFKIEQEDSLDKMLFYSILTLAIICVVMYWGGNLV